MRMRFKWALPAIVALALGIAACGSSSSNSSSSSSGGSSGGSSSASSGSKGPIKLLSFGDVTGLSPTPSLGIQKGPQGAVNAVNAKGGINGHQVQLILCDTKLNPADAASCVEKAKAEGVVAAVPSEELLDNVTTPLLDKLGIPILGSNPSTAAAQFSKTSACFLPGVFVLYPAGTEALAKEGAKSVSVSEPAGIADENVVNHAATISAQSAGGTAGPFVGIPPTASNFSSIVAQSTANHQDGSFVSATPPGFFSLVGGIAQAAPGSKLGGPGYTVINSQIDAGLAKIPAAKGMYVDNYTAFPSDTSIPGIKLYQQQVGPLDKADLQDETTLFTWVDMWGALQILQQVKGDITPQSINAAMKTATVSFQGVAPNWHYQYDTLGLGCDNDDQVYEGHYEGGSTLTPMNGDKPRHALSPQIIALYKKTLSSGS
jgi:branched-chain amino acid transport system substrate-binding protein